MAEYRDYLGDSNRSAEIGYPEKIPIIETDNLKPAASALMHSILRWIAEIPFSLRIRTAPDGEIKRNGETTETGKIARFSGKTYVLIRDNGSFVFPNEAAGDTMEKKK